MSIGFPLGLLTLLGIAPLVAAYFLRRRQKPVRVSALFLWRSPDQRAEAGPRLERFSREVSLALEILAVIAAAVFLSDVGCGAQAPQRQLVVVVDGSLSMSARRSDGKSVAEHAREEVARAVEQAHADRLTVVESGVHPRVLAGPAEQTSRALAALERWHPRGAAHDLQPAIVLARELAGPGERIVLVTDALPDEGATLPPELEIRAVGERRDNVAIVAAQRTDQGELARISVRIVNFGAETQKLPVELHGEQSKGTGVSQTQRVEIAPGGSTLLTVGMKNVETVSVRLPKDALEEDGALELLPAPTRTVGVRIDSLDAASKSAIERFAQVAPGVALVPDANAALSFGAPGSDARVTFGVHGKQRTFVGPFFAERANPVLEDVQLAGVVWTAGENPPGHPLLSAGEAVLLSEDAQGRLHFNLDLSRSNVQRTQAWPVLMGNLVRRTRGELPGFSRRHVSLGEELPVVAVPGTKQLLRGPDGEHPVFGSGPVLLPPPGEPGHYELLRDGEVVDALEVLPIDARESDLRTRGAGQRAATAGEWKSRTAAQERSPWALLALLALLLADFAVTGSLGLSRRREPPPLREGAP